MSEKDKAVEMLKNHGYHATNNSGVIMVKVSEEEYKDQKFMSKIDELLKKSGYNASRGFTVCGNGHVMKDTDDTSEPDDTNDTEVLEDISPESGLVIREDGQMSLF